ncbi:MAG: hypothetical protein AAFV90_25210, partial [Cyanobacteria bacterium J06634_5]
RCQPAKLVKNGSNHMKVRDILIGTLLGMLFYCPFALHRFYLEHQTNTGLQNGWPYDNPSMLW